MTNAAQVIDTDCVADTRVAAGAELAVEIEVGMGGAEGGLLLGSDYSGTLSMHERFLFFFEHFSRR